MTRPPWSKFEYASASSYSPSTASTRTDSTPSSSPRPDPAPILEGHFLGLTLVETLIGQRFGIAGIAIAAGSIKGALPVPISSLRSAFAVLENPAHKDRAASVTAEQIPYKFGNTIDEAEANKPQARCAIPALGKPLFQAATANFGPRTKAKVDTNNPSLLLIMGGPDRTMPEAVERFTMKEYRHSNAFTDRLEFPDRRHSLVIDRGRARDRATRPRPAVQNGR